MPTLKTVTLSSLSFKAKGTGSLPLEKPSVIRKITFLLCFLADWKMVFGVHERTMLPRVIFI